MVKIGIVILNWNGYDDTIECIDSLLNNSFKDIDIIVVDNNSKNGEGIKIQQKYKAKIHFIQNSENLGFAGGCNVGIKKSLSLGNSYTMLFNNDAVAKNGFIESLLEIMDKEKRIGIIGPLITYYNSNTIWFAGGKINYWIGGAIHNLKGKNKNLVNEMSPFEIEYMSGCCMLIKKEVLEKIGLLDEKYFAYVEEVDFCYRGKKEGYTCVIDPGVSIEHKKSASAGNKGSNHLSEIQAYLLARNGVYFGRKNLSGIKKYWYLLTQFTILPLLRIMFQIRNISVLKAYINGLLGHKKEIK